MIHWLTIVSSMFDHVRLATMVRRHNLLPRFDCAGDIEIIGAIAHCLQ